MIRWCNLTRYFPHIELLFVRLQRRQRRRPLKARTPRSSMLTGSLAFSAWILVSYTNILSIHFLLITEISWVQSSPYCDPRFLCVCEGHVVCSPVAVPCKLLSPVLYMTLKALVITTGKKPCKRLKLSLIDGWDLTIWWFRLKHWHQSWINHFLSSLLMHNVLSYLF